MPGHKSCLPGTSRAPERGEKAVAEDLHEDAAAIWTTCLESLDGAGSTHKAWLAQTRPVAVVGDTLVLAVPDEFQDAVTRISAAVCCVGCRHCHVLQPKAVVLSLIHI